LLNQHRAIVDAMRAEQDAFVTNVVFDSTKKYSELFTANYAFVNDRLATYYGLPIPGTGEKTTKVALKAGSPRGGILGLGMFLFGHARLGHRTLMGDGDESIEQGIKTLDAIQAGGGEIHR